jgi:hypothetical protein
MRPPSKTLALISVSRRDWIIQILDGSYMKDRKGRDDPAAFGLP